MDIDAEERKTTEILIGCGFDVVMRKVAKPKSGIELEDVLSIFENKVILQGGMPVVLVGQYGL